MSERKIYFLKDPAVISKESRPPREVFGSTDPINELQSDEYGFKLADTTGKTFVDAQVFDDIPGHRPLVRTRTASWYPFRQGVDAFVFTGSEIPQLSDHIADYGAYLTKRIHEFNERVKKGEA